MSRIGRLPVVIPDKVTVELAEDNTLTVKGPKGELSKTFAPQMEIKIEDNQIVVNRPDDSKANRALHGLTRALIANMVTGVSQGFTRKLEIIGIGYKAEMKGKKLVLSLGYSHPIVVSVPDQISIKTNSPTEIEVSGIDKELVGMVAAKIRSFRKPEPYKGKGVRYAGEYVRRKAGKAAGK
ncbi:MAG TPA: 50S ribosomal protein L6 [Caldithrix abyssi]|uniref:Large ribosomal subunit protein uL6 n=1 Tax=Caldithrix abyssi TaxID=187145 RepID=A0A7V5PQD4_CALAY|nr:50S ribosomal protein L6 [Caldithrix abyssi]